MLYLMLHMMAHHNALWHVGGGPYGWWAWSQKAYEMVGFGFARGHFVSAFEVR